MVKRKDILKNVRNYSPQEIADAIKAGVVSFYDLSTETGGAFTPLLKRKVKSILDSSASSQQDKIVNATSTTATAVSDATSMPPIPPIPVSEGTIPVLSLNGTGTDDTGESKTIEKQQVSTSTGENKSGLNLFSIKGRIGRAEYFTTCLVITLLDFCIFGSLKEPVSVGMTIFLLCIHIPMVWVLLAQGAKRCHDIGRSGMTQIVPFYFFFMILQSGNSGTNEYGEEQK